MNAIIETAFSNFSVNGVSIPVTFVYYEGHGEPYITYAQTDAQYASHGDDALTGYVDYYDFDIYSKGNYFPIIAAVKEIMEGLGFLWLPEDSSGDLYENDTGYHHKTLCFAIHRNEATNTIEGD